MRSDCQWHLWKVVQATLWQSRLLPPVPPPIFDSAPTIAYLAIFFTFDCTFAMTIVLLRRYSTGTHGTAY